MPARDQVTPHKEEIKCLTSSLIIYAWTSNIFCCPTLDHTILMRESNYFLLVLASMLRSEMLAWKECEHFHTSIDHLQFEMPSCEAGTIYLLDIERFLSIICWWRCRYAIYCGAGLHQTCLMFRGSKIMAGLAGWTLTGWTLKSQHWSVITGTTWSSPSPLVVRSVSPSWVLDIDIKSNCILWQSSWDNKDGDWLVEVIFEDDTEKRVLCCDVLCGTL